jgi:hypothetical protein
VQATQCKLPSASCLLQAAQAAQCKLPSNLKPPIARWWDVVLFQGEKCIFPIYYDDIPIYDCITYDHQKPGAIVAPWCFTSLPSPGATPHHTFQTMS